MDGWKVTAIIFIVLFVSLASLIIWATFSVIEDEENESECMFNICAERYIYYEDQNLCECYDNNFDLTKQEYLK